MIAEESIAWGLDAGSIRAFWLGILSASSLLLGTVLSIWWRPTNRTTAALMSFGGGALLAALTIDMVAVSVAAGQFNSLAVGCVCGGFLFEILNRIVNSQGGFLRKLSTTVLYLRRAETARLTDLLPKLGRLDLFHNLPRHLAEELARRAEKRWYEKGTTVFRQGDPADELFIVQDGVIELVDSESVGHTQRLNPGDAFGHRALFSNDVHRATATAELNSVVWSIPRSAIEELAESPELDVSWHQQFALQGERDPSLSTGTSTGAKREKLVKVFGEVERMPIFRDLPERELKRIADCAFYKLHKAGHTFFRQNEPAERMYVLDQGEVAVIKPDQLTRTPVSITSHDCFGGLSLVTGARHAATAVAVKESGVWVIRKQDFDHLLLECPWLARAVEDYLEDQKIADYLQKQQHVDADSVNRWVHAAIRSIDSGKLIPSTAAMTRAAVGQHGAPLAIWIGILLDGIPESFVIGSHTVRSGVSLSLIAGLFLANFPEALSCSVGMRQQGLSRARITLMWGSITLITGVGALLGNLFLAGVTPSQIALVEGVAAGAMLTMIAETMLPEAYFKGGSVVGLATLFGFLVAISFQALGSGPIGH